jgi:hypothetical protein
VAVDLELYRGVTHDFIKLGRAIPEAEQAQAAGRWRFAGPCTGLSRISGGGQRQAAGRPGVQAEERSCAGWCWRSIMWVLRLRPWASQISRVEQRVP